MSVINYLFVLRKKVNSGPALRVLTVWTKT